MANPTNPIEELMLEVFKRLMIKGSHDERIAFTAGMVEGMEKLIGSLQVQCPDLDKDTQFKLYRIKILISSACAGAAGAFDESMKEFAHKQMAKLYRKYDKPLPDELKSQ